MTNKRVKLWEELKNKRVGVFADDSNLYHARQRYNWKIDFSKLREFLAKSCQLEFINYYIAVPAKSDAAFHLTQNFIAKLKDSVSIKTKDLKYTPVGGKFVKKADVDVEIVLDVVRAIDQLDAVIILSGDSDLLELKNFVVKDKNKEIIFWAYEKNMAWELKYCWHLYLDDYENVFRLK